ncbi:hypothetical protein FRC04_000180 [Tulasnella sp. 424]|nr:hypothetical protein FRC04_000180 [Tulasnella sp. 424]
MQTKLEDTEKKLAAAQLEMDQFKEKTRIEAARSKRKWKDEADSLRAELEQANKDVEYLTRRLEDEKLRSAKDTAALVSDAVKTTLEQYVDERIARTVPSQQSLNSTKAKAQAPTTTVPASSNIKVHLPSNKSQVEAKQSSGSAKPKISELPSAQRPSSDSRHIQPPRSPSPNGMDWTPTEVVFEPSK